MDEVSDDDADAYTLTETVYERKAVGSVGGFSVKRQFKIEPKAAEAGFVLQHVTRTFAGLQKYVLNDAEDDYEMEDVADPDTINAQAYGGWTDYWEIFPVDKDDVNPNNDDAFALTTMAWAKTNAEKNKCYELRGTRAAYAYTTDGAFTETGSATFYEGNPAALGFGAVAGPANGLDAKKGPIADPGPGGVPKSDTLDYDVTSTWDSSVLTGGSYGKAVLT